MGYTDDKQCDSCNELAKLGERVKTLFTAQEKLDRMFESVITLTVKFDESSKRSERNSRILWGVLTAVIAQGIALLAFFVKR